MEKGDQGYEDDRFENIVDEEFHCAICLNVFKEPVQCQNNEHYFCAPCIQRHLLANSQTCPSCMEELTLETLRKPAMFLTKHLSKLMIRCENVDRGCAEFVKLGDLATHLSNCGFARVTCSNDGCNVVMNKQDQIRHEDEVCYYRKVSGADYDALRRERDEMKTRLDELNDQLCCMVAGMKDSKYSNEDQRISSVREDIIIAGGKGGDPLRLDSVEMFSWTTRRWERLQSLKKVRSSGSSVFYEGRVIVMGGSNRDVILDNMEALNFNQKLISPAWSDFPKKLAKKCTAHQSVVYKDRLFVIGGNDSDNVYKDIHEIFLVPPYFSNSRSPMLQKRSHHGAALIGNKIVVVGGTSSGLYKDSLDCVEMYDINKNECTKIPTLPFALCKMATVSWGENVIVAGGYDKEGKILDSVVMYNVKGEIRTLPPMKHKRTACLAVVSRNGLVVMGGWNKEEGYLNSVECFSFDRYMWEELPPMIEARCFATATAITSS